MYQKQPRPSTAKKFNLPPPTDNIEDYMYLLVVESIIGRFSMTIKRCVRKQENI